MEGGDSVETPVVARDRKGKTRCIVKAGVAIGVVILLGFVGHVALVTYWRRSLEPYTAPFVSAVNREDYDSVYNLLCPTKQTKDEVSAYFKGVRSFLGRCEDRKSKLITVDRSPAGVEAQVRYSAKFEREPGSIHFLLLKRGKTWRILAAHYDSRALSKALRCERCGYMNTQLGRRCQSCGRPMNGKDATNARSNEPSRGVRP